MAEGFFIDRKGQIEHLINRVTEIVEGGNVVSLSMLIGRTRSSRQRAALEVWCRTVADLFNESGITRSIHSSIFRDGEMECPWSQASVKDEIWRPMQRAIAKVESTTEATTKQYVEVYEALVRAFGNKGITLPKWPVRMDRGS